MNNDLEIRGSAQFVVMILIGLVILFVCVFGSIFYEYYSNGAQVLTVMRDTFFPPNPFVIFEIAVIFGAAFLAAFFLRSYRIKIQGQRLSYSGWRTDVQCALADLAEVRSYTRRTTGPNGSSTTYFAFHRKDGGELFTLSDFVWSLRDRRRLIDAIARGNPSFKVLKSAKEDLGLA